MTSVARHELHHQCAVMLRAVYFVDQARISRIKRNINVQVTVWLKVHLRHASGGDAAGVENPQAFGVIDAREDVAWRSAAIAA
jgi:hypothetical protein